ncbi:peptide ABC transporter substrate-binding protein [Tropicimonas sediminicola]|uniref:Oligopeptide transport system substrate-binding protein n=1 Tax=Tropicimonas sediminicola TaxID=1031541 RepID=A0A239IC19_9RHOB|nr:peptide ABC transporter substrate-binding protein [Tropicimonas sediminicola]SNS89954.1 oligopeptide transport system substrate-binding protein [Tropicimonas sediminicola]
MNIKATLKLSAAALVFATAALAEGTHPVTGEALADNQTFSYRLLDQFPTLDPQLNEETAGHHVIRDLFEGLMIQDADGNLIPGVATGFEASNNNQTYTFTLRPEAKWSNGDPVVAEDFVYGWQRAVDPANASPYAWYMELASIVNAKEIVAGEMDPTELGVKAIDDHTLEVQLTQPLPYFPAMTTYATMMPAHRATIEAHGAKWTDPENIVSNGAYVLTEMVLNEYHTREKNPMYWNADSVIIEKTTGYVINDVNQALTRYKAGEIDHLEPLPDGQFPVLQEERPDEATSVPRLCSYYYAFNLRDGAKPELQDPRVRQALAYAIDRDVIVNQILKGGQWPAYNFAHLKTAGFEMPEIEYASMSQADRDAKAKELMEEAGVSDLQLKLIYNTSDSHKAIATIVAAMWKQKLGVETTLENMEWKTYLDVRRDGQFDVARGAWCADYNEASTFLDLLTTPHGSNDAKYSSAEYDELLSTSKTSDNPNEMYTKAEKLLSVDMPIAPIYHYANTFLLSSDVKGWPYNNAENNWYSKDLYRIEK